MAKLTNEDKILGRTEPIAKKELKEDEKFLISLVNGQNEPSVFTTNMLQNFLPQKIREELAEATDYVEYNGFKIEKIKPVIKRKKKAE